METFTSVNGRPTKNKEWVNSVTPTAMFTTVNGVTTCQMEKDFSKAALATLMKAIALSTQTTLVC